MKEEDVKYEIQSIDTNLRLSDNFNEITVVPRVTRIINLAQYDIIDFLANKEIDEEFDIIYIINNLKFKIVPHYESKITKEN